MTTVDEPLLPREQELAELKEYFVSTEWKDLRMKIENELDDIKEFLHDQTDVGRAIDTSMNKMREEVNEMCTIYKEHFRLEHIQKILQRFIIDDNNIKIESCPPIGSSNDSLTLSKRDVMRFKAKILRYFLSFEFVYRAEKD